MFAPLIRAMRGHECLVTTRTFSGLPELLRERGLPFRTIGGHQGSTTAAKGIGTALRTLRLAGTLPRFDASVASLGVPAVLAARMRGRPAIGFLDGDLPTMNLRACAPFVDRLFVPTVFADDVLDAYGLGRRAVRYDGFKEDLAAAGYAPDPAFPSRLPFRDYVLVRAEALRAEYVPHDAPSLVPELVRRFEERGVPVLFLPRYLEDRAYAEGRRGVFMPPGPVNGLDACHYARAVLTGSGTLAREAAVLGVPAASFFPGRQLLSVDREMVRRSWIFHSRDPDALVAHAMTAERRAFDRERCDHVLRAVSETLETTLGDLCAA